MNGARRKTAFVFGLKHRRTTTVVLIAPRDLKVVPPPIRGPWTLKAVVARD
jgi:hypothetical protein